MSQARDQAEKQSRLLAAQIGGEQNPRPAGGPDVAAGGVKGGADLGARFTKAEGQRLKGRVNSDKSRARGGEHRTSNIEHPTSNGRQKGEPSGLVKRIQRALDVINAVR
jgi:hypothetical protein